MLSNLKLYQNRYLHTYLNKTNTKFTDLSYFLFTWLEKLIIDTCKKHIFLLNRKRFTIFVNKNIHAYKKVINSYQE